MNIKPVDRVDNIDKKTFQKKYLYPNKPVIFRNPDFEKSRMANWGQDYLCQKWGETQLPIQIYPAGGKALPHYETDRGFDYISMREFFERDAKDPNKEKESLLLGKLSTKLFPKMDDEYIVPDLMPFKNSFTDKLWIYSKSITPLHYDVTENLLHQAVGRKRVIFFRPTIKNLYAYPFFSTTPHFSQVDLDNPDYEKFPLLKDEIAYECILEEGDILYIPFGWWHQLWGLSEMNISVAHWYYAPIRKNFMCPQQAIRLYKMTLQRWLMRYPI